LSFHFQLFLQAQPAFCRISSRPRHESPRFSLNPNVRISHEALVSNPNLRLGSGNMIDDIFRSSRYSPLCFHPFLAFFRQSLRRHANCTQSILNRRDDPFSTCHCCDLPFPSHPPNHGCRSIPLGLVSRNNRLILRRLLAVPPPSHVLRLQVLLTLTVSLDPGSASFHPCFSRRQCFYLRRELIFIHMLSPRFLSEVFALLLRLSPFHTPSQLVVLLL